MTDKKLINQIVAGEIRSVRTKLKKTQMQVLTDTHIHIGRIEMGQKAVALSTLIELCNYFGISTWEIIIRVESELNQKNPKSCHP